MKGFSTGPAGIPGVAGIPLGTIGGPTGIAGIDAAWTGTGPDVIGMVGTGGIDCAAAGNATPGTQGTGMARGPAAP